MKAKEYANRYIADRSNETLGQIFMDFVFEIGEIAKTRKTTSDDGVTAIVDEQAVKWRAFARLTNGEVSEDGFVQLLEVKMPEIHAALIQRRSRVR